MFSKKKSAISGILLVLPYTAGFLLFYGYPFVLVLRQSLRRGAGKNAQFVGLEIIADTLRSSGFRLALGNTVKFLAVVLPAIIVLSFAIALTLRAQMSSRDVLRSVVLLPYLMPVVGAAFMVDSFLAQGGMLSRLAAAFGGTAQNLLDSPAAFWAVVLLYLWKNTGYSVILLLAGLNTIPPSYYEAAQLDGAGKWQLLRYITMPQMWYSLYLAGVFSLINAFKCFREIFLIGGEHPNRSMYMLQHFINNVFEKMDYSRLSAASMILFLVLVAVFVASYWFVMRKEAAAE